ncbi:MAG: DUF4258 domain-containing protein [Acidobacteriota bacterium]|nr:DUF4258 domain-containing protein [Acidobacteriota bacterium]
MADEPEPGSGGSGRRKVWRYRRLITEHAFDKLRQIDCTFAEFEAACETGEVIEEREQASGVVELVLVIEWLRPLHAVVDVDEQRREERVVTVYEPDPDRWSPDYRRRR